MGFTRVDNWLFDVVMPNASPNAFKVVSAVVRLTVGWQVDEENITFDKFLEVTGIVGRGTLNSAISEAIEKGFIECTGSTRIKYYSIKTVLTEEQQLVPEQYQKQYENSTKVSAKIVPSLIKEKKRKKNINKPHTPGIPPYELPPDAMPYPEHELLRGDIVMAITGTVKTASVGSEDEFEQAAEWLIGQGVDNPETVRGFREWWHKNGYYKGKPALKSFLDEFSNYLSGIDTGQNGGDYKALWKQVRHELATNGRRSTKSWNGRIAPALKKLGGYKQLCGMNIHDAERAFETAFNDLERTPA